MSALIMRTTCMTLLAVVLCISCSKEYDHQGRTPLAEVDGNFLYLEDLRKVQPAGLSKEDSLSFATRYIRHWVEDVLLYEKAQDNISDSEELERLVAAYRKSLVMHSYQQALIHQELSAEISESELQDYYQKNQELFKVEQPLLKGLFLKVPLTAPRLAEVRRWYKQDNGNAIENLEKYSLQHAVKYEYFYDRWIPAAEISNMLPMKEADLEAYLGKQRHIEVKDTAFYYFLNVSDYLTVGQQAPFDFAQKQAKEMLLNIKQVQYLEQVKADLYRRAERRNRIKYYNYNSKDEKVSGL